MGYLPSKNFIAPVSAILVILFAGWFITQIIWDGDGFPGWRLGVGSEKNQNSDPQKNKILAMDRALEKAALDTDGDGLKDWEEVLWKTDPKKKDTDGDGSNDGDEIKDGRDPAISKLTADDKFKKPEEFAKGSGTSTPKTISQKAADEFASSYFTAKARLKGGALSNGAKQKLVMNLLLTMQKGASAYKDKYFKKDVKIAKDKDAKNYLNRLGAALDENFKEITEPEIDILNEMANTGNFSGLDKLDPYILAYKKTMKFLEPEAVPEPYSELHLALLNSMNNTLIAVESFRKIDGDPVRAMLGLQIYYKELFNARQYLTDLKKQTDTDKIVFGENEEGHFFNQYFAKIK